MRADLVRDLRLARALERVGRREGLAREVRVDGVRAVLEDPRDRIVGRERHRHRVEGGDLHPPLHHAAVAAHDHRVTALGEGEHELAVVCVLDGLRAAANRHLGARRQLLVPVDLERDRRFLGDEVEVEAHLLATAHANGTLLEVVPHDLVGARLLQQPVHGDVVVTRGDPAEDRLAVGHVALEAPERAEPALELVLLASRLLLAMPGLLGAAGDLDAEEADGLAVVERDLDRAPAPEHGKQRQEEDGPVDPEGRVVPGQEGLGRQGRLVRVDDHALGLGPGEELQLDHDPGAELLVLDLLRASHEDPVGEEDVVHQSDARAVRVEAPQLLEVPHHLRDHGRVRLEVELGADRVRELAVEHGGIHHAWQEEALELLLQALHDRDPEQRHLASGEAARREARHQAREALAARALGRVLLSLQSLSRESCRRLQGLLSGGRIAPRLMHPGEGLLQRAVEGGELGRLLERQPRALEVSALAPDPGGNAQVLGLDRAAVRAGLQQGQGTLVLALSVKSLGESTPRLPVARGQGQGLLEMGQGLVGPTRAREQLSHLAVRGSVVRIPVERVGERGLGCGGVSLGLLQRTEGGPGGGLAGPQAHRLLVGFDRSLGLAHQLQHVPEAALRRGGDGRVEGSRLVEGLRGAVGLEAGALERAGPEQQPRLLLRRGVRQAGQRLERPRVPRQEL
jgi:hypothetical protein